MPNTLAHIGLQGLLGRAVTPTADFKWVCLGCVIPDVPWILQRIVSAGFTASVVDPYDLRLYAIVQSSLIACLVLSLAISLLSSAPRRVFMLLAFNSFVHLLLDAMETKWANGVNLFAPFSWQLLNFGLWWPESNVVLGATICGALFLFYGWWRKPGQPVGLAAGLQTNTLVAMGLLAVYFALPFLLMKGPEEANSHFVKTFRQRDQRAGKMVEFDRARVLQRSEATVLRMFTGEELTLLDTGGSKNGTFSVRGQFVDQNTVEAMEMHEHPPWLRDSASVLGLALIGLLWLQHLSTTLLPRISLRRKPI